ncbi:unnamed protein product [Mucor hiemalis]
MYNNPGSTPEGWEPPYAILNPDNSIPLRIGSTGPRFCRNATVTNLPNHIIAGTVESVY